MKRPLLILALLSLPVFIWLFWQYSHTPETLSSTLKSFDKAGEETRKDLLHIPSLPVTEDENSFILQDDNQTGISITYANQNEGNKLSSEEDKKDPLSLSFPKDQTKPIEIRLDKERTITIQDLKNQNGFSFQKITDDAVPKREEENGNRDIWYQKLFKKTDQEEIRPTYLTSSDQRKTLLYTFQKDHATNEKKLKSWTLYQKGNGIEEEAYQFTNAKIKINDDGNAEVFYFGEKDIQNQKTQADVEPSLLERAQRVISQDMGDDILNGNKTPDFLIPKPFFYDKNGDIHETDWKYDEATKILSLQISTKDDLYPIALDPTLAFTVPVQSNTGSVIDGEIGSGFGAIMAVGDFNADGKIDLAVGASGYSSDTGRVYIFYNDGGIPTDAVGADVVITGEAASYAFGNALLAGDFNADGKTDLVVESYMYNYAMGRVYFFYNDGSYPALASSADTMITGESTSLYMGTIASGDINSDGKSDLILGIPGKSPSGRTDIFYNDGSYPADTTGADLSISGEASGDNFGSTIVTADFNFDGKTDLAIDAPFYGSGSDFGRAYIFYNDGSIPTTAATADVKITGDSSGDRFGYAMTAGDLNADGRVDLVVGVVGGVGAVAVYYNDGSYPTTYGTADLILHGGSGASYFGKSVTVGDMNADGRTDIIIGAYGYPSGGLVGSMYIFYNDGSYPYGVDNADVAIYGESTGGYFGSFLITGDLNADGRTDLVTGAYQYASSRGKVYIFYSQNGQINTNVSLIGETTSNNFGSAMTSGDFNADGKTDLAVGAYNYSSGSGRAYLFYNDGSIPTAAASADVIISPTNYNQFGISLAAGDFNADGTIDIVVGADVYSGGNGTGRAYIFYADGTNNFGTVACTGSAPTVCSVDNADVIITGESLSQFGNPLVSGDFNADGKTDLAVGAYNYSSGTGRTYLFYNDGSIPTTAATADVIIVGETTSNYFGWSLASGDWNADGKTDLAVGAYGYSTSTGRVYLYETRDNFAWQLQSVPSLTGGLRTNPSFSGQELKITGEVGAGFFGASFASGDFNADGKTDLAVGASSYVTNTGRVYIFYNDGHLAAAATNADVIITGETTNNYFGASLTAGDFNADGRTDLAVGATGYSSSTGRAYIFYNDGSIPIVAVSADVIIIGETASDNFGCFLVSGDFNSDGKNDLSIGAFGYSSSTGRAYIFYNDGSIPTTAATADVIITGGATANYFGSNLVSGDFNADGKTDLAVGAYNAASAAGRTYLFYNDGSIPTTAATADVIITGESTSYFGNALTAGDLNGDGKIDLAIGGWGYSTSTGRTYIFYNDGSIPTTAATADVIITGESTNTAFGYALVIGDFNADGKIDLAVGANGYSTITGRAYIFYNDGSIPTTAATADVIITGEAGSSFGSYLVSGDWNTDGKTDLAVGAYGYSSNRGRVYMYTFNDGVITGETTSNYFGCSLVSGDFNADSKTDLAVGARGYSTNTGRVYLFYNDGSLSTASTGADVIITGETTSNYFGASLTSGDFNADGKTDLVVGSRGYSSSTGRVYLFYNDGSIPTTAATADVIITGETTNNYFGTSLASGDFNADGRTDLVVGAYGYSTSTGRAYIFYNDGSIPTTAATADVIITGETTSTYFGSTLVPGDFNTDGKTDLAVGAYVYSTNTGRVYIFYNDGSIPTTAATADVIITGEASSQFGVAMSAGDWNADGRIDLAVGGTQYSSYTGRAYLFYNDGSIPTTAATADVIITTSEGTFNYFGCSLTSGDWNADGKTDLTVGAYGYSSYTGRAYIFYNDGSIPTTTASADVIIQGETTSNYFGYSLASGDFNADGKIDLAVGAYGYSTSTGRAYIFITEAKVEEGLQQLKSKGTFKAKGSYQVK